MKKNVLLFLFFIATLTINAQIAPNFYWIQFTDKNNSPYSVDIPEAFLSQRALERRARLGIVIDAYDLPVTPQYLEAVSNCGAEIVNPSKWLNGVSVRITDPAVLEAVNALDCVASIRECPNDPKAQEAKQHWMANELQSMETPRATYGFYGGGSTQISQIRGDYLHGNGYWGEGMVIAVLDGGFIGADIHPAFDNMREEGRLLGTRSFVAGHPSVYDQSAHGCSCLSTMAAYVPDTFVGTAPKASYYLLMTESGDYENIIEEYNWVSGAEYADSLGVDVCSTSLGYINFDMSQWNHPFEHFDGHTAPMTIGAEIAASRGMLCCIAAGNEGDSWDDSCTLGIPGDAEHVLTVGAVDASGNRTWFSSVGPTYDGRIKPDIMAMGGGTYVAGYGSYYNGDGTSFATPVLAGAVTCLWQANYMATVDEVCEAVRQCSSNAANPDNQHGYGIPNCENAFNTLHVEDTFVHQNELIKVYPNPSQGNVRIVMKEGYHAELSVCDPLGRQLKSYHFNGLNHYSFENFLNGLSNGIYFIKAESERGSQTLKLIIAR
ncbi:MAG: S8 family peptidase [Bacteroidales bacterium]|nr:S8 family peptidase [Bacteroidales bacterium]